MESQLLMLKLKQLLLLLLVGVAVVRGEAEHCEEKEEQRYNVPVWLSHEPRIYVMDGVFTKDECEQLIRLGINSGLEEAYIMGVDGQKKPDNGGRKTRDSESVGLHKYQGEIVKTFRTRLANVALMPEEHGEVLQVTRYKPGQHYDPHFDSSLAVGRLVTALVFLNDVKEGGYTSFPWAKTRKEGLQLADGVYGTGRDVKELIGVTKEPISEVVCTKQSNALLIKPKMGRVIVFFNHKTDLKRESYRAMHCGCPVIKGEKYIAQLWLDWHNYEKKAPNDIADVMRRAGIENWQSSLIPLE